MTNDLWKLTAVDAVGLLKKREISPLDLMRRRPSASPKSNPR